MSEQLTVLRCERCGAAAPLRDTERTRCRHCGSKVRIPAEHRARHVELADARKARAAAEETWRRLPRPLPLWIAAVVPWLIAVGLPLYIALMVVGWVFWGWFPTPLHMLGWGIFTPVFAVIFFGIDAAVARAYSREHHAMNALRTENGWNCRACGGPLAVEEDRLAATCDYCCADSVLTEAGPRWHAFLKDARANAHASLARAARALAEARSNRRMTRIIVLAVLIPFWLFFCWPLVYSGLFAPDSPSPQTDSAP